MSDITEQFIVKWHVAVEERCFDKIEALLADDFQLISPVAFKPFSDRQYIMRVLENVVTAIEGFHYIRSTSLSDGGVLLVFQGELDGQTIEGIDLFDLNEEGKAISLKVMLRPFKVYSLFVFTMAERLGLSNFKMKLLKMLMR